MADFDGDRFSGRSPKGDRLGSNPVNRGGFFDNSRMSDDKSWGAVSPSTFGATSYSDLSNSQISQFANALAARTRAALGPAATQQDLMGYAGISPTTTVRDLPTDIVAGVLNTPPNTAVNMAPPTTVNSYAPTAAPPAATAIGNQMNNVGRPGAVAPAGVDPASQQRARDLSAYAASLNMDHPAQRMSALAATRAAPQGLLSTPTQNPFGGLLGALAGVPAGIGGLLGGLMGNGSEGARGGGGIGGGASASGARGGYGAGDRAGSGVSSNGAGRRN